MRGPPGRDYTLTLRRGSGTVEVASPHVVLAIPLTMLRRVRLDVPIPPAQRHAIEQLPYGTNAKLMIGFDRRLWRERYGASGTTFSDLPYQVSWETSRGQSGSAGILTNFTGGANGAQLGTGSPAQQADRTVRGLEEIFPGIAATRAGMSEARFHWPSHEWTLGS